ncbi:unnamed protein product [Cuscuta campestris]|uniref:Uncharacterized protein n=1 Tax=Cuscuta campestris TaxID=132261 RepID=A0A484M8K3_9ASTE|nr:unnamed protein product [Cuscuta campestris]
MHLNLILILINFCFTLPFSLKFCRLKEISDLSNGDMELNQELTKTTPGLAASAYDVGRLESPALGQ